MLSDQRHAYPTCLIDAVAKSVYWQGSWMLSWMNLRSTNFNHNNIKLLMEQPPTEPKNLVQFGFRFSDFKERVMTYRAVSSGGENVFLEITLEVRPFGNSLARMLVGSVPTSWTNTSATGYHAMAMVYARSSIAYFSNSWNTEARRVAVPVQAINELAEVIIKIRPISVD